MKYYSTVNDIVMSHSKVLEENGFDFMDLKLPGGFIISSFGFSEDEILDLKDYARDNEPLVWEFAREGGAVHA